MVALILTSTIGGAFREVANGGSIGYDERVFQDYAASEYAKAFGASENGLLIVFLTNEECDGYYCIAWVGDNIETPINLMFGDESTAFGQTVKGSVNREYYAHSLDSNLATVMDVMSGRISGLGLKSSFKRPGGASSATSRLINYTDMSLTEATVNQSLNSFTEETGIPAVIVVETMEAVFGKTLPMSSILIVIAAVVLAIVAIWLMIKAIRNRKNGGSGGANRSNGYQNGGYQNGGYQSGGFNGNPW